MKKSKETQKPQLTTNLPTPNLPKFYSTKLPVNLSISEEEVKLPGEASILSISPSVISESDARTIAKNLDFEFEPKTINSALYGKRLFWNSGINQLYVSLEIGNVSFGTNNPAASTNRILSDTDLISKAQEFIEKKINFVENFYTPTSVIYFKKPANNEGSPVETDRENAYAYTVNYGFKISNLEVINPSQKTSPYNVTLLSDGQIIGFNFDKIVGIKESDIKYSIKNYNDIKSSLDQALLLDVEGVYVLQDQLPASSISSINIKKVYLGYLVQQKDNRTLIPIIILKGDLKKVNDNINYKATLFMPAEKNP